MERGIGAPNYCRISSDRLFPGHAASYATRGASQKSPARAIWSRQYEIDWQGVHHCYPCLDRRSCAECFSDWPPEQRGRCRLGWDWRYAWWSCAAVVGESSAWEVLYLHAARRRRPRNYSARAVQSTSSSRLQRSDLDVGWGWVRHAKLDGGVDSNIGDGRQLSLPYRFWRGYVDGHIRRTVSNIQGAYLETATVRILTAVIHGSITLSGIFKFGSLAAPRQEDHHFKNS